MVPSAAPDTKVTRDMFDRSSPVSLEKVTTRSLINNNKHHEEPPQRCNCTKIGQLVEEEKHGMDDVSGKVLILSTEQKRLYESIDQPHVTHSLQKEE